jgi:lysine 2,3-aminomutase
MINSIATSDEPTSAVWGDWQWQQKNSLRTTQDLARVFPGLSEEILSLIERNQKERRFQITPYTLGLIERVEDGSRPVDTDPVWRQLVPLWDTEGEAVYRYNSETENWELPGEMVTPIAQHKYDNRIIVRISNVCHGYCQFCYEALRTLEKSSPKDSFQGEYWKQTVNYIAQREGLEEVILSGGEPLMRNDEQIDSILHDLRSVGRSIAIRIHTRALLFNPFRITPGLLNVMERHGVNAVGVHVCHPNEITEEFYSALKGLQKVVPIIFANIPLLRGINDDQETMHELAMKLYRVGVIPHYLYHFLPFSPGAEHFRTPVQTGIDIIRSLKRRITNIAVPEFVVAHTSGKHSLPLLALNEEPPRKGIDASGNPVVRYTNWKGEVVEYLDTPEE